MTVNKARRKTSLTSSLSPPSGRGKNDFTRSEPLRDHTESDLAKKRKSNRHRDRSGLFPISESAPYLQIQSVPVSQRIDPEQNSYILVIQPAGVRAAGGQYTADEAHEIAKATRGWDWSLDKNDRPKCLPALERLLDQICKRSAKGGEK